MAFTLRKAKAERERLKTIAVGEQMSRRGQRRRGSKFYLLLALAWAVLAALPSVYVSRPLPYMVGSVAGNNVYSRVDFRWHDAHAEAQALKNLESSFPLRYRQEPLSLWAAETHGSIDQFLTRAAAGDLSNAAEVAAELNIQVTPEQLQALWGGTVVARNDPYHYLVTPLKEVLENEVYAQGVLDHERFDKERGRTIQINRDGSSFTAMVGSERGPMDKNQVGAFLDGRFRVRFSAWLSPEFKTALRDIVAARMRPTLVYDENASRAGLEERREELLARVQTIKKDDILVSRGETLAFDKLAKIREEERVYRESQGWRLVFTRFLGNLMLFAAISMAMVIYFRMAEMSRPGMLRRFLAVAALSLVPVFIGYLLIYMGLPGTMLPIGLVVGITAFGTTPRTAIFLAAMTALCGLILFEGRPDLMVGYLAAALFYINTAPRCRRRFALLMVSCVAGLIGALGFVAWNFARGDLQDLLGIVSNWSQILDDNRAPLISAAGLLVNWIWCGLLVLLLLPLIERFFGVTTRISMQDLTGQDHPLLKRLILEAPGTYHHSNVVATLAEAAADAVGADGLRARIGGMFHDVGKLLKPEYFSENEAGVSRHANLNPNMSALLIINHVRDGAELARAFHLPNVVTDMIKQHHGDSLMKYFHHKAMQQAAPGTLVPREPFIYPGPKPQSPEAGVLMIADSVEAALRSLDNPSPQHLRELIRRLIRERLIEGQFEESGLSMRQLAQVEDVLFRMLASMYHTRVKYPGQEKQEKGRKR